MSRIKKFFLKHYHYILPSILVFITTLISVFNFTSGTWLVGWDTLLPELNFPEHFSRSLSGVWRQDQGLGAVAAHAHMSELPRIMMLWVLHFVLPLHTLRYIVIFLCLIAGPLGVYFFVKEGLLPATKSKRPWQGALIGFLAALFYLFNLGTVQHFIVVFEMFAFQYAFLGWLFLVATLIMRQAKTKHKKTCFYMAIFWLLSFFSSPMAYASQLWFAYLLGLIFYLLTYFLMDLKNWKSNLIKGLLIGLLTLTANAYWMLPNFYFLLSPASSIPAQSQINQSFSIESFLSNAAFSGFIDTVSLRSFLFEWQKYNFDTNSFEPMLMAWHEHLNNPLLAVWPMVIFIFAVIGVIYGFIRKQKWLIALLPVALLAILIIMNANPVVGFFFSILRDNIPLVREGLRTPWTKFSILLMLAISVLSAFGFNFVAELIMTKIKKIKRGIKKAVLGISTFAVIIITIYFGWPMFQGYLIHPQIRQEIPETYFRFWEWAQTQPDSIRMALLPAPIFTAWEYHTWGFEGAGFLWFGMPQPLLTRDFDRWNPHNETFYRLLSRAIYDDDWYSFNQILERHRVTYLVLDESYFLPHAPNQDLLYIEQILEFFEKNNYSLVWAEDFLYVFRVPIEHNWVEIVYPAIEVALESDYLNYNPTLQTRFRYVYQNHHRESMENAIFFPFTAVYRDVVDIYEINEQTIAVRTDLPEPTLFNALVLPPLLDRAQSITTLPMILEYDGEVTVRAKFPTPNVDLIVDGYINETINWPLIDDILIPVATASERLIVDVGGRQFPLTTEDRLVAQLQVSPDTTTEIIVFRTEDVFFDENLDTRAVATDLLITHEIQIENLLDLYEPLDIEMIAPIEALIFRWPLLEEIEVTTHEYYQVVVCGERGQEFHENNFAALLENAAAHYYSRHRGGLCAWDIPRGVYNRFDYLLKVRSEHLAGRPLNISIHNDFSGRTDFSKVLPEGISEIVYSVPGWNNQPLAHYTINWENRSFGPQASINYLHGMSLFQVDLRLAADIQLVPSLINFIGPSNANLTYHKTMQHRFEVEIYGLEIFTPTLIAMNQSYQNNWVAYDQNGQRLPSVEIDGWRNGFIVTAQNEDEINQTIIIRYRPQDLSTFGYFLIPTTMVGFGGYLIYLKISTRKKKVDIEDETEIDAEDNNENKNDDIDNEDGDIDKKIKKKKSQKKTDKNKED
ncbi:MAG: hypothetical protein LBG64_02995 [Pseudomonadales bacterium]|jgi:hypothetical protein|nr:hypothetical protein [Pseudomonadales bacterium]